MLTYSSALPSAWRSFPQLRFKRCQLNCWPRRDTHSRAGNIVYLALGSNLGDSLHNITSALHAIEKAHPNTRVLDSSFLYRTKPMYLDHQPDFLNAACKISTPLAPQDLLKLVKQIELEHGRQLENVPRNSPRPIDIDILLYNSDVVRDHNLTIPHVGIVERQFVLEPLNDVARHVIHPDTGKSIETLLSELMIRKTADDTSSGVQRIHAISGRGCKTLDLTSRTHLMSIVNCTPDSFSDGGESLRLEDAVRHCMEHVSEGADIVDIGGMSTRPGATDVSVEEEIRRTVPVIRALRETHGGMGSHISIDTFRAATARAAVAAGATMVNDVSGGDADGEMLATVARLGVPYVLMHMRGTPRTMGSLTSYDRAGGADEVDGVREELAAKVQKALHAGIRRWNLILDPGFGFAKDLAGNCRLLHNLASLQTPAAPASLDENTRHNLLAGFPLLVGLSRKSFLAQLLAHPHTSAPLLPAPDQRLVPTIVASTLAIRNGAHILRAHDTKVMKQVLKTVDGIHAFSSSSSSR
ncbi:hypothetical protein PCANC_15814 [Puccinia coronata f. sp. avenae]|uniref:Pterin-binding domain-containing protein n=1 Tax=Puccinia coronata f. sp. avenae TaxID=200324 RepID=A0A2N5TZ58_9BASI|nr:hypothetical protein PCASD_15406 [Puccinia coronata f. sp. avenae]PLW35987.1 hypothetical protein PCANC_15814 [Puccinia coronata f. sp. avenae]